MPEILGSMDRGLSHQVQDGIRKTSRDLIRQLLRFATGSVLGLTVGLVVQEILGQPSGVTLAFTFAFMTCLLLTWRLTRSWAVSTLLVFDLIMILTGLVLRLYIMAAPNA